jgi:acyl-CoA synthetase (AMP-forming)/AMP-acid ligase II
LAQQENGVTTLFAFVEGTAEEQVVLAAMREKVPGYMLPRNVFSVPQFPINTSGKIDKQTLRKNYLT